MKKTLLYFSVMAFVSFLAGNVHATANQKWASTPLLNAESFSSSMVLSAGENAAATPVVGFITSKGGTRTIVVRFNDTVDKASSETKSNYTINNGVTVESAVLGKDERSVILTTSALSDQKYQITIANVKTIAGTDPMAATIFEFTHYSLLGDCKLFCNLDILKDDKLVADESTRGFNGQAYEGVSLISGVLGNAYRFDGTENGKANLGMVSFGSQATVSLWVNMDFLPSQMTLSYGSIFDGTSDQFVIYENKGNATNPPALRLKITNPTTYVDVPEEHLKTGEWIYVVATYANDTARMYINGVQKGKTYHKRTGDIPDQESWLGISSLTSKTTNFAGSIDAVEVYGRAFTPAEVVTRYNTFTDAANKISSTNVLPEISNTVNVYPNPVKANAQISLGKQYQDVLIKVIDARGKTINRVDYKSTSNVILNCENLVPGIYFLNIILDNQISVPKKIVVQ